MGPRDEVLAGVVYTVEGTQVKIYHEESHGIQDDIKGKTQEYLNGLVGYHKQMVPRIQVYADMKRRGYDHDKRERVMRELDSCTRCWLRKNGKVW